MFAVGLLWMSAALASPAVAGIETHSAGEVAFLKQVAIPPEYSVAFESQTGRVIPFAQFQAEMAARPFNIIKDTVHHRATLKLESDEAIARSKQAARRASALPMQGQPFPAFHASTIDGKPISLASLRGKPFVVNFFFALCAPCIAETPVLSQFHAAHPRIPVVAFTFDDAKTAREFARAQHFNWPVVAAQDALAKDARVDVYPTLMLVNAEGVVTKAAHSDSLRTNAGPLSLADLERWASPDSSLTSGAAGQRR